jgi:hypothetical protein
MDAAGRRLAKARLPEGVAGMARLHAIVGELAGDDADIKVIRRDRLGGLIHEYAQVA